MKIKDLDSLGAFAEGTERKEIEWTNPKTGETHKFDIFVKRRSYGSLELILTAEAGTARCAMQISECVVLEANETFTYEEAFALEPSLGRLLNKAVEEVNAPAEKEAATKN
jgi:hypothetical protein